MCSCPVLYPPAQGVIPTVAVMWGHAWGCLSSHCSSSLPAEGIPLKCSHVLFPFPEDEQLQEVQSRRFALLSHPHFLVLPLKYLQRCKAPNRATLDLSQAATVTWRGTGTGMVATATFPTWRWVPDEEGVCSWSSLGCVIPGPVSAPA